MEYVDRDEGGYALSSLVSDLGKHPGTRSIMTQDLQVLAMGELLTGGTGGIRRFIEGIPTPIDPSCRKCGRTDTVRIQCGDGQEECRDQLGCITERFAESVERAKRRPETPPGWSDQ